MQQSGYLKSLCKFFLNAKFTVKISDGFILQPQEYFLKHIYKLKKECENLKDMNKSYMPTPGAPKKTL